MVLMKKIIAYSLWGDSKFYCQGAIENVYKAQQWYPDWICRFYVAENCPALPKLQSLPCEVVIMPKQEGIDRTKDDWKDKLDHWGMFWRFFAMSDQDVDRVIFRDCDSRLSPRERAAVREWEESDYLAHRMHDNPSHWNAPIMGGMWGIRGGLFSDIKSMILDFIQIFPQYNEPWIFCDLIFIRDVLYPYFKHSCMGHGIHHARPFPQHEPMEHGSFVGECIDEEWRTEKYIA
jgi:hypothetical protein